jgi:proteasome accessory factor B
MSTRPSRLERITNLFLALLETPRPLSLREIGTAVAGYPTEPGALRQAFERDKRTLRDEGVPVAVERIDGEDQVGYRILPEEYTLSGLELDRAEQEALSFALAMVRLEGAAPASALAKLTGAPSPQLPPVAILPRLPALGVLQEGIRRRARATFTYHGRLREVEGHGLVFRLGAWYLVGVDRRLEGGPAIRTFRVDRLEDVPLLGEPESYALPEHDEAARSLRVAPWVAPAAESADASATGVVIEVDVRELRSVVAVVGEEAVEHRARDGSARLRFAVGDEEGFVGFVLGLGDAIEVISPEPLRAQVIAALERAIGPSGR